MPTTDTQTSGTQPQTNNDNSNITIDFDLWIPDKQPPHTPEICNPFTTPEQSTDSCNIFENTNNTPTNTQPNNIPLEIALQDEPNEETQDFDAPILPDQESKSIQELASEFNLFEENSEPTTQNSPQPPTTPTIQPEVITPAPINFSEPSREETPASDSIPTSTFSTPTSDYTPTDNAFSQTVNALNEAKSQWENLINSDVLPTVQTETSTETLPEPTTQSLSLDEMLAKRNNTTTTPDTNTIQISPTEPIPANTAPAEITIAPDSTTTPETNPLDQITIEPTISEPVPAEVAPVETPSETIPETTTETPQEELETNPFEPMKKALEEKEKADLEKKWVNTDEVQLVIDAPTIKEEPKPAPQTQPLPQTQVQPVLTMETDDNSIPLNNQIWTQIDETPVEDVDYQIEWLAPIVNKWISLDDLVPETPQTQPQPQIIPVKKNFIKKTVSIDMNKIMEQLKKAKVVWIIWWFVLLWVIAYALFPQFFLWFIAPAPQTGITTSNTTTIQDNNQTQPTVVPSETPSEVTPTYPADPSSNNNTSNEFTENPDVDHNITENNNSGNNVIEWEEIVTESWSTPFIDNTTSEPTTDTENQITITSEEMKSTLSSYSEMWTQYLDIGTSQDDICLVKWWWYVTYYSQLLANQPELDSIRYLFVQNRIVEILDKMQQYLNGQSDSCSSTSEPIVSSESESISETLPAPQETISGDTSDQETYDQLQGYVYSQAGMI